MPEINANIAIIGGGPAGSSTAIRAAQTFAEAGLDPSSIVIVERRPNMDGLTHLNEKVCGGFVLANGIVFMRDKLGLDLGTIPHVPIREVTICDRGFFHMPFAPEERAMTAIEPGWGATFHRKDLDAALIARAQDLGVSVLYDARVTDIESKTGRGFVVKTDGHFDIATRMLVGAYGTNVSLQRKFFDIMDASLDPRYNFVAVAYRFVGDGAHLKIPRHTMRLGAMQYVAQDGYVGSTYAWDWPAPGGLSNKGFGFFQLAHAREASNLRTIELMKRFFPEDSARIAAAGNEGHYKVRGARLPIYHPDSFAEIVIRNGGAIAVCGDAAGRINPVTGEGITEALEDGELGAALAKAVIAGNFSAVRKYAFAKRFLKTEIYRRFSHAFASEFVLNHRHFQNFIDSLVTYPAFTQMFTGLVRGRIPTSELLYSDARLGLMTMVQRDPRVLLTIPAMVRAAFRI